MTNFKTTIGSIPQVGRSVNGNSHPLKKGCLTDSGGGKNSFKPIKHRTTGKNLFIATFNARTLQSDHRLEELEEELTHIRWDVLGLCETRRPEQQACTTLKSGHLLYANNTATNTYLGGVAIMVNKKIKNRVIKMSSISPRVIYIVLEISKRYRLQIVQVYAPTSSAEDTEVEQLYEDITLAIKTEKAYYSIIMGDFNAKVGNLNLDNIPNRGNFGQGNINERGETLVNYLQRENLYLITPSSKNQKIEDGHGRARTLERKTRSTIS